MAAMALSGTRSRGRGHGTPDLQGQAMADRDRHRLLDLIEEATMSPSKHLDVGLLQFIKELVRASDANVRTAFESLYDKLKKNHSQVRYLAVLLIDELFTRSKLFRSLLVPNFEMFMLLTIGYRGDYPLPKPSDRASLLRAKSMEYVEKWNDMFGIHYKQVRLGYEYLKKTLRLQFPNLREAAALAELQQQEKEERTQALIRKRYESFSQDFLELKYEISSTLDQMAECCRILAPENLPTSGAHEPVLEAGLENLIFGEEEEYEEYGDSNLRRQLHEELAKEAIVPEKPRETADNFAVFETLRDLYKLVMTRHLTSTQEWLSILMRVDTQDTRPRDVLLKEVIDLRNRLLEAREKCESLGIDRLEVGTGITETKGEEDDIIWEEGDNGMDIVNVESIAQGVKTERETSKQAARFADVAGTSNSTGVAEKAGIPEVREESDPRTDLLKKAPVLTYGAFLDVWGAKSDVPANQRGLQMENHWGKFDSEAMIPADKIAELNVRTSYYKPPEKEIPPCRTPLKKGGLCQRRDLRICPLHGPIIPRDENGIPIVEAPGTSVGGTDVERWASKGVLDTNVPSSSSAEVAVEREGTMLSQSVVAAQAIANVRERDVDEAKRKKEERIKGKRTQSKRDREHNEAVLRSAALAQTAQSFRESFGEDLESEVGNRGGGKKRVRGGLTALLKKKPTVKDRLAQRLLNGRVRDNAVNQLTRDEDAHYREAFPNQWELL